MRTPPASSRASASSIAATGSPRLPPKPSRASATARPLDAHAHIGERGVDRSRGLAQLDLDLLDGGKAREDGLRHRFGGGFDEVVALGGQRLGRECDHCVVAGRLRVIVALARRAKIEMGDDVDREALAEPLLLRGDAVAGEDLKVLDDDAVAHAARLSLSATRIACTCAATSWTRTMSAPAMTPMAFAATVPGSRLPAGGCGSKRRPMKDFRDTPRRTGKPSALILGRAAMASNCWAWLLPKPMPGSSTMRSSFTPARRAVSSERSKKRSMSSAMSIDASMLSRLCISTAAAPNSAATAGRSRSRWKPQMSLTIAARARSARRATSAFVVS